jgi:hypothetical protein
MINISAVIEDLGASQKAFYLIKEFNKISSDVNVCASIFFERPTIPVTKPLFACRSISFLSAHNGSSIATTLQEADRLLKSNNSAKKYLYLWDLEWLEQPVYFSAACNILRDERLSIIARSDSHAKTIENFCNRRPCGVVDNWDSQKLISILTREEA